MSRRRPHNPVVVGPSSIRDLDVQVEGFRLKIEQARERLDRLKAGTNEYTRPPGRGHAIAKAECDLAGAIQGLRNAERILRTKREIEAENAAVVP